MRIKVLFFAKSREVAGLSEQDLELRDGANTEDLLCQILASHPALESVMKTCVFALNQEYVRPQDKQPLKDGDEVAIIPPLSGG
jgi:molybdopterin converting factor subunit 1